MSCIQNTHCRLCPSICFSKSSPPSRIPVKSFLYQIHSSINNRRTSFKLTANVSKSSQYSPSLKYKLNAPVCLFGGEGKTESSNEDHLWESLENATTGSYKKSIEDVLREQIEKKEYAVDPYVGSGGKPPRGGSSGGSGGDNSGGSEDDLNETLQVLLATVGFIIAYLFTIRGEEMILLARDYIKFLCTGHRTFRLRKTIEWWEQRWPRSRRMAQRKLDREIEDEDEDEDEDDDADEDPTAAAFGHDSE